MEDIKQKINEHDLAIKSMADSIRDLAETTKDSNKKLGDIAMSMSKQELILEKLTNLEGNTKDSINRVHKRIDSIENVYKEMKQRGEKGGCTALQVAQKEDEVARTKLEQNVKSNQKRLDENDKHKTWIVLLVIGAVITAVLNLIFK